MYVDSTVFLLSLLRPERTPSVAACDAFLDSLLRGSRRASTATLTWDEVTYIVRREVGPEVSIAKGRDLLDFPHLGWLAVTPEVLRRAEGLYRAIPIRPRDAIHGAVVLTYGLEGIVSADQAFDGVPGLVRFDPLKLAGP